MTDSVHLHGTDFWVKIVGMLQQNWALIEAEPAGRVRVRFIADTSGIFDEIGFESAGHGEAALTCNGFRRFADSPDLQSFLQPPSAPFRRTTHPNGPIYSSGRYWQP